MSVNLLLCVRVLGDCLLKLFSLVLFLVQLLIFLTVGFCLVTEKIRRVRNWKFES